MFSKVLMIVIFLAGILIMLYPFYVNAINHFVDNFRLEQLAKDNTKKSKEDAKKRKAAMQRENEKLKQNGLVPAADPFTDINENKIANDSYLKKHLIGAVSIPAIEITIPLFDKTNDMLLQSGATVLQGTSFPTGGIDTHSVISAHSGLPEKKLFTDLEEVKKGDVFVLTVFDEKLAYKVDKIEVVKPEDTSVLKIEPGRDIATLLTCTPYMINSHRLLVTGHRVPYTEDIAKKIQKADKQRSLKELLILIGTILAVLILLFGIIRAIYAYRLKKHRFDLSLIRRNTDGAGVAGITYGLYTKNGKKAVVRNQIPLSAVTDEDGWLIFEDLPGGIYQLKEASDSGEPFAFKAGIKRLKQEHAKAYPKKHWQSNFISDEHGIFITKS